VRVHLGLSLRLETMACVALCCGLMAGIASAQDNKPNVMPNAPSKSKTPADEQVPLLAHGLRLADFVGMQPRPELKGQLTEIDDFIQNAPVDGRPATEKTVAWFGYTPSTLYVVFACYDYSPGLIRGHLTRRENILSDDTVSVLLDPFQDRRRGILFSLNPANVQADAAWTEGSGPDYSYDQVWDSEARTTSQGWMALFAIPFRSVRFRPGVQGWGVVLMRNLPRNSEADDWPHISTNVTGTLPQEGTLRGIQGVTGSHNLQLNPYVLGQNEHTLLNLDPLNPYFSSRTVEATAGGEAKVVLKDSIVLDATINPDFSDIESDQPQFTVNQRYPVYYPELRPFFLENANYFATPIQLVYTRNIVRPTFGVRATGKVGGTNLGFFLADDREPGETFAPGDADYGKKATFAVGRVSQDLGKGSSIGLTYTDEEFAGSWNRIGGVDFTARLSDKWTAQGQAVESSTLTPDLTANGGNSAAYNAGPASYLEFTHQAHTWYMDNTFKDFSTGFQSQVGFIQTTDFYDDHNHGNYYWYPKHSVIQSYGLEEDVHVAYDHQGNRIYHYSTFDPFFLLPGSVVVAPLVGENSDTLGPQDGYAIPGNINFTENFGGFVFRGAPLKQLNLNLVGIRSGNVNYNPAGSTPTLLNQETLQALISVYPIRSLTIDNTYLLDRDHETHGGQDAYESQTFRTKINYQFTTAFSARVIVEYDSTLVNPLATSLLRTKGVSTEALLTWLPHPGTAIYIGYNNDIQNLDRSLCDRVPGGGCNPANLVAPRSPNYLNDGRQIFIKASYLLRF
jgi:hypothetical protein